MNSAISSVAALLKCKQTSKGVNTVSYSTSLVSEILFNNSLCISMQIKDNVFEKVTKIFFPNRFVILFSFDIDSNITCSTKYMKSDILNM